MISNNLFNISLQGAQDIRNRINNDKPLLIYRQTIIDNLAPLYEALSIILDSGHVLVQMKVSMYFVYIKKKYIVQQWIEKERLEVKSSKYQDGASLSIKSGGSVTGRV